MWQVDSGQVFWYISRTSGLVAYLVLFINFYLGVGLKTKFLDKALGRWRIFDLHQFTAMVGGALVILHVLALLGDSYFHFTWSALLVPLSSPYRPFWTALGVIGLYGGVALALSAWFRRFIGQKIWKIIHYVSYLLFFSILVHGIKAGTDSSMLWVQAMYILTGTSAAFLLLWRFLIYRAEKPLAQVNRPA